MNPPSHDDLYRRVEQLQRQLADLNSKAAQVTETISCHAPYGDVDRVYLVSYLGLMSARLKDARALLSGLVVQAKA